MKIKCRTILAGMLAALCAIISFQPASADSVSSARSYSITSFNVRNANITGTQIVSGSASTFVGAPTADLYFAINISPTIPANSLVYLTLSMTGADTANAPVCFSGGWGQQILDCDINGDNGNYTISALIYTTSDRTSLVLYNYVQNPNFTGRIRVTAPVAGTVSEPLTASDIDDIKSYIDGLENGLSDIYSKVWRIQEVTEWTNDDVFAIRGILEDMQESQEAQQQAEQNATDNIENQTTSDSSYSESTNQQTTSLISAFGGFVSAIGNIQATSCDLSLPLPNFMGGTRIVNACTAKTDGGNDVITIINIASSIMAIIFYIPFALMMINLIYKEIRSFTN